MTSTPPPPPQVEPSSPPAQKLTTDVLPTLLTLSPDETVELWLARTDRRNEPEHWVLQVRKPNADRCTFYDLSGGLPPSTYSRSRTEGKRFEHHLLPTRQKIGEIKAFEEVEVVRAALDSKADHCQRYILGIIERLEEKELVAKGTAKGFEFDVQMNLFEGPNKPVREATFKAWVKELGEDKALNKLREFQGFL
ncbi:hypothetical protein BDV18DRAFT_161799 [Aspergillus unguis]